MKNQKPCDEKETVLSRMHRVSVRNPSEMIFALVIGSCFFLAVSVSFAYAYFTEMIPNDLVCTAVRREAILVQENKIEVDGQLYGIVTPLRSGETFRADNRFSVWYSRTKPQIIWAISDEAGNLYFSAEDTLTAVKENTGKALRWALAADGVYLAFAAFWCYVVSHASRFPHLVRLLVKKSELNLEKPEGSL